MKKTTLTLLSSALIATTLFTSGCATIFGKSSYDVTINSTPVGAQLLITDVNGKEFYKGQTPATVNLKSSASYFKKASYQLKFDLANHEQKVVTLTSKLNGWYIGNLLVGGLIGMLIIDPISGAMYKIPQTTINETLTKKENTAQVSSLQIFDINSLSKEEVAKLVRVN